ncbi:histidine phosphatase family protein [Mesobacterium sp. TK19101]|uniref:Histidine phosphatase family protein n=1 Tax=Mesobacterium hydrothermale TaxID=3111907 RepID=A0ABU6HG86_9RHOB|nr:histidine phosphatase family protein [Mesobacterium sp. TK19101]MEC3861427.1 histidine phosphatase family protein [Mesobacterium sp. TK19101]
MRLILMRHAKSDWSEPGLDDHDRPLNGRGRKSAKALGAWLRGKGYLPDQVLCSSALRTRETLDRLRIEALVSVEGRLYHASPNVMWDSLSEATGQTVLMVGHNPGIAEFAAGCVAQPPAHSRFFAYPTGATLVVDFEAPDWSHVRCATGTVWDFVVPRDLLED